MTVLKNYSISPHYGSRPPPRSLSQLGVRKVRRLTFPTQMQTAVNEYGTGGDGLQPMNPGQDTRRERVDKGELLAEGHVYNCPKCRIYRLTIHNISAEGVALAQPFVDQFNRKKTFEFVNASNERLTCKSLAPANAHLYDKMDMKRNWVEFYFIAYTHSHWRVFWQTIENNLIVSIALGTPLFITTSDSALTALLRWGKVFWECGSKLSAHIPGL